jgi:PAS domain S-box-containing protein
VDDERSLLEIAKEFLELEGGFRVDTAISPAEGLAALSRGSYDAIVSDYLMPEMDGIEFLKKIRTLYGDIPFILFTGSGHEAVVIEAINHGADSYLRKQGNPPEELTELTHIVERVVKTRKKLEESRQRLQESEERYRTLAEAAHDLIYIIDREDRVAYLNTYAAKMLDLPREQAIGRPRAELFPPDISERQKMSILQVIDSGIPLRIESETPIGNNRTWQDTMLVPLRDPDGTVTGVMGISRDVTDLKQAIEDERRSERRFLELADLLPEIVFETDAGGTIRFTNRLGFETFGITPADIEAGCTIFDFIAPEEHEIAIRKFRGIITGEWSEGNEYTLIRKDGGRFPAYVSVSAGFNGQRMPDRVWGVIIDLTGSKRAENALRQANRQLTLLNAITRHDILNNVTVMLGYLTFLKEDDTGKTELLDKIESATYSIRKQIEFSRVYQNLGTTDPQWQRLDNVLPISQIPPHVILDASLNGIEVFADPMIERVFYNLLDNSLKHGGSVTAISTFSLIGPDGLTVVWQDNGRGICPDEKDRIFERGYGKNNGLGLFLVREILAITGIAIRECGNEGEGARFEISVPMGAFRIPGTD